jgi:chemotaxis family two-component system response regulator PixG
MVIDDNLEFLKAIQLTLEMEGYRVITAANGQAALDKLQTGFKAQVQEPGLLKRLPDLILADIMMPLMDGYNFFERVRANPYLNHIPFVFITAKSSLEEIRHGKELGADDYLTKPFSPEDLLAVVRGKLKRREQQQILAAQFTGDPAKPTGVVVALAVVGGLLLLALIVALIWLV